MKIKLASIIAWVSLASVVLPALAESECPSDTKDVCPVCAAVTLVDGSVLRGECVAEGLRLSTLFSDELLLPVNLVSQLELDNDKEVAKVRLVNEDSLTVKIKDESFQVASLLGDLQIPFRKMSKVIFTGGKSASEDGLLYYSTFDSEASVLSPIVGPKGVLGNATFVPGKVGNAARIPRCGNAGFVTLPKGFFGKEGCVEFWAKIDEDKERFLDCDPRLLLVKYPSGSEVMVEYSANNGAGMGGLNVRLPGLGAVSSRRLGGHSYREILGNAINDWHHYAVSWTQKELVVYIDGMPFPMAHHWGAGIDPRVVEMEECCMGLPNIPGADGTYPRAAYLLDEFKIWNHARSTFDL